MERAVESAFTHVCVIQDDVIPCANFSQALIEAIVDRRDDVLSLWVGGLRQPTTKNYRQAQIAGERWVPIHFSDIHHCVGLVWPRLTAEAFLEWTETSRLPGEDRPQQSDDAIVGAWARRTHNLVWAHIPCLVEHDDNVDSTIGRPRGDAGRRAISFAGP